MFARKLVGVPQREFLARQSEPWRWNARLEAVRRAIPDSAADQVVVFDRACDVGSLFVAPSMLADSLQTQLSLNRATRGRKGGDPPSLTDRAKVGGESGVHEPTSSNLRVLRSFEQLVRASPAPAGGARDPAESVKAILLGQSSRLLHGRWVLDWCDVSRAGCLSHLRSQALHLLPREFREHGGEPLRSRAEADQGLKHLAPDLAVLNGFANDVER